MEELLAQNPNFQVGEIESKLRANATPDIFASGTDPTDFGSGLVQAPQ